MDRCSYRRSYCMKARATTTVAVGTMLFLRGTSSDFVEIGLRHPAPRTATNASAYRRCLRTPQRHALPEPFENIEASPFPLVLTLAGLVWWFGGPRERQAERDRRRAAEAAESEVLAARAARAYVEPRSDNKPWTAEELAEFDGSKDPEGPILIAVDSRVFNVWKGRHFYAPGCEYHIFAGRDATRLLARGLLEEEPPEDAAKPLTLAEQASLQTWLWTFENKYEVVGVTSGE